MNIPAVTVNLKKSASTKIYLVFKSLIKRLFWFGRGKRF